MNVPEHFWRFPTAASIEALARRFGLSNRPGMQDWPIEVADAERIDEFLSAYEDDELTDDDRFTLMEILLQSFEEFAAVRGFDQRWPRVLDALESNIELHAWSVWYWSGADNEAKDSWFVAPSIQQVFEKHRDFLTRPL
jgi:hypothetical protein